MNKILCLVFGCLLLAACTATQLGTVSTVPWDESSQLDGLSQQYSWGEDDGVYDGMTTAQPPL